MAPGASLPASVELVEELGGSRVAYCNCDGRELAVVLPPGDERLDGRTVWLDLPVHALQNFDRVTGKRLEFEFTAPRTPIEIERPVPETV